MPKLTRRDIQKAQARIDNAWGDLAPSKVAFDNAANLLVSHQILGQNPGRVALHFVGPNQGIVTLAHDSGVVLNNGLTFSATAGIMTVTKQIGGRGLIQPWFAIYGNTGGSAQPFGVAGAALSGAATGAKLSFTVPANAVGQLLNVTLANFTGAPTIAIQVVRAATTFNLGSFTAATNQQFAFSLQAGDVVQLNVTTAVGASVFDGTISGTEVLNGAAPSPLSWLEVLEPDGL